MVQESNIQSQVPLKQVVFSYIDQSMKDRSAYRRLYPIAVRGVLELGADVFMYPKTCKLNVSHNQTVPLPDDFLSYVSVGVLNIDGQVAKLRYKKLTDYKDTSPSRTSLNTDASAFDLYSLYRQFFLNYYFVYPYNNLFGIPSGKVDYGWFSIDYNHNVILLNNEFAYSYVILEYLGLDCGDDMAIPFQCQEAMIAWLSWKDMGTVPVSSKAILAEKQMRRKEYYIQKQNAKMRISPLNLSDAGDIERQGVRLTVKA